MEDLTIVYYTANLISDKFSRSVRDALMDIIGSTRIVSVSHKPMDFGDNICIGEVVPCCYNLYKQILIGAREVKTKYMACAEDDSLYTLEHLSFRPPADTFAYNANRWNLYKDKFVFRDRLCMSTCIAPTELMVETLGRRFAKFPNVMTKEETPKGHGFSEPGLREHDLGLPKVKAMGFKTNDPPIVFWHRPSLGAIRKILEHDIVSHELPYWGDALTLWNRFYERPAQVDMEEIQREKGRLLSLHGMGGNASYACGTVQ
jgi:hypothetical protein